MWHVVGAVVLNSKNVNKALIKNRFVWNSGLYNHAKKCRLMSNETQITEHGKFYFVYR